MVAIEFIESKYPLHLLVWNNEYRKIDSELSKRRHDIETKDNRGRTPLMLAVTLGHLESVRVLLNYEANVNCENSDGWTVTQEAVSTGDPELLHMVLEKRDFQRYTNRVAGIPELLLKLKEAPDFYVEMKWEFISWVPLVSRMCPSDTYKVYKQGSNVRIDTTLLGFDHTCWQRGRRSYIFQGRNEEATMMEIDHDLQQVYFENMRTNETLNRLIPSEDSVSQKLTSPIVTTYIDTDKICFERNKAGLWGWRSEKNEMINGHDCKVFNATSVELVTKTRMEHLTESDKARSKNRKTPFLNILGITEIEENQAEFSSQEEEFINLSNPYRLTPEEYFDANLDLKGRDVGRPKDMNIKVQKFKANLWLCEQYPLSLPEQILPIVDLMAISSSHFAKLKNFIQMQLPSGFPVKIEIPLFHVLNARITFGNIFATDSEVPNVHRIEEDERLNCVIDDCVFDIPPGYTHLGNANMEIRRQYSVEEEDDLLQFAIQQSLIDAGTEREEVDIWEALKSQNPSKPTTNLIGEEEKQLQRAIQASLEINQLNNDGASSFLDNRLDNDPDLQQALVLSQKELQEQEQQKLMEEKILQDILNLSLTEK